ncbi:MAG: trigger factor [Flavobacteriales bacterium]
MNVTQENIDALNAKVKIEIAPEDYEKPVREVLDNYRKKMTLQGFRPGKVPFGVAKKMYGKAVLAEELNKILSDKLNSHIRENELNILGQPIPQDLEDLGLDFDKKFEFTYDLGLAPDFQVDLSAKDKFNKYKIKVDKELIEKYVRDFQRRFGKSEEVDKVTEKDMIYGTFYELDKNGEKKAGGYHNHSTIVVEYVDNKDARSKLIGLEVESKIKVEPAKLSKGDADLSAMLGVPVSELGKYPKQWELKVESIHRIDPHPLNKELFDKVLGPNLAETEEEFRTKISDDLGKHLEADSDKKLKRDISDSLLEKLKLQLPDNFLKRWLLQSGANSERPITQDDIDREYDDYSRFMKLQLIESEIAKNNEIKVDFPEIQERTKANIKAQFGGFGSQEIPDEMLTQFAQNFLQKEEEVRKVYDQLLDEKIMAFYKATVKLQEKEVSFDEFVKLASTKPGKGNFMDQVSNLLKF